MSILYSNDKGWVISHYDYSKKLYRNVHSHSGRVDLAYNENLFDIITPLMYEEEARRMYEIICVESSCSQVHSKLRKRSSSAPNIDSKEARSVENLFSELIQVAKHLGYFDFTPSNDDILVNNLHSRNFVHHFYEKHGSSHVPSFEGGNNSDESKVVTLGKDDFVIPSHCYFISSDICNISTKLRKKDFDFILLDPPWNNRYIKRKKKGKLQKGYSTLNDGSIMEIPIDMFLSSSGLVGIWCTNSESHIRNIKECFFPKWKLEYVSTWFWIKVTKSGEPICSFSNSNGKRPYERIIFGTPPDRVLKNPEENKCIISTPSALHSHKPPLTDVLQKYLPESPECLELFARYLLPGWTSVGNQVLMLQTRDLFIEV